MEMVVFIVYCVLSYWAVGQTIYANKIQIGSPILTGVGMPVWKVAKTRAFSKRRSASGFV